jgi:hypothetical protein
MSSIQDIINEINTTKPIYSVTQGVKTIKGFGATRANFSNIKTALNGLNALIAQASTPNYSLVLYLAEIGLLTLVSDNDDNLLTDDNGALLILPLSDNLITG